MEFIWHQYLFQPLFNALIFIYNNFTFFNMGLAVIYLTIALRICLLPLSILEGKSPKFYNELANAMKEVEKDYPNDIVKQKEIIKEILRKNRVHPWAKVISLGIQLLVLILLYQVFMGGIQQKFESLYSFVPKPDFVYTSFLWFDISQRDFYISILVGIILFLEITIVQRNKKALLTNRDIVYRIIFPVFSFLALYILPSVKSIFILTSILFSFIIIAIQNLFWKVFKNRKKLKKA